MAIRDPAVPKVSESYSKATYMPLQISPNQIEGITLVRLKGRLVLGQEASSLQDFVQNYVANGNIKLILNLKEVPFIDSTGLGVLVIAHLAAQKANGSIRLLHLSKRHIELLVLTKLSTVFEIFDDESTAIDSFFPDRIVKPFDILQFVKSQENKSSDSMEGVEEPEPGSGTA